MTRSIKILKLALVSCVAIGALGASIASADEITSESSPVKLSGVLDEAGSSVFTITAGNSSCKEAGYEGTITTPTTTLKATPVIPEKTKAGEQNCTSLGFPGKSMPNGCAYAFTLNGAMSTTGGGSIECPEGNEITTTSESAGTVKCTIHIPAQALPANSVTLKTIGAGTTREITGSISISSSLKYSHTKGSGLGACTAGSGTTGSLTSKAVITGSNDGGGSGHIGLFLS